MEIQITFYLYFLSPLCVLCCQIRRQKNCQLDEIKISVSIPVGQNASVAIMSLLVEEYHKVLSIRLQKISLILTLGHLCVQESDMNLTTFYFSSDSGHKDF